MSLLERWFLGKPFSRRGNLYEEIIDGKRFVTTAITDYDKWGQQNIHSLETKEVKE